MSVSDTNESPVEILSETLAADRVSPTALLQAVLSASDD